jgi:hypothetical protein
MYCPNCSQQQISEETKFCSRCGFSLALVAEIVAHDGFLPQVTEFDKKKSVFTRRNGLIFSLFWFMLFVLILTPIFGGVVRADSLALAAAILGTMGSLLLLVASFTLLKKETPVSDFQNQNIPANNIRNLNQKNQTALPPQQSIPVSTYVPTVHQNWRNTKDLVQPSVTEGTTKLLREDEQ